MHFLFIFLTSALIQAQEGPVFVNRLVVDAEKTMNETLKKPFLTLKSEGEKRSFATASLAKIALLRLQGREQEALQVFRKCDGSCRKFGSVKEWDSVNLWACSKEEKSASCPEKAKTRKPPQ